MSAYRSTFISHAHADNALCDRYVAALRARGVDLWYDRENAQNGHLLGDVIQRELEQRSACVVLLTQNALDSFWVSLEIQTYLGLLAKHRARLLLPVRIAPCAVPSMLNAFLWLDALDKPFERAIEAIATALIVGATHPVRTDAPAFTPSPSPTAQEHAVSSLLAIPAQPGPAPTPQGAQPVTPTFLNSLGYRVWQVQGVECILPPLCPVPSGPFLMGSNKSQDLGAMNDETPQLPVEVDDFSIGQHPVTVAEYARAVRAGAVLEPQRSGEVDWQTQLSRLDSPVVYVSWHDALAYAAWLAKTTGQPWRLPTEAEWEKAARWDLERHVSRIYPWGDTFDKDCCNTYESGIKSPTPVGRYPTGASPCGAQDMAGNVWEWVSSLYKSYPYREDAGQEDLNSTGHRVLRGGSWSYSARYARAAYRTHDALIYRLNIGFRLACSGYPGA